MNNKLVAKKENSKETCTNDGMKCKKYFLLLAGLRHTCTESGQCDDGMICGIDNKTRTAAVGSFQSFKLCLCDEEVGYQESFNLNICNGRSDRGRENYNN